MISVPARLLLLGLNFFPLLHALGVLTPWICPARFSGLSAGQKTGLSLAILYLLPPLLGRLVRLVFGEPELRSPAFSRSFFVWWATLQFQGVFGRFPFLEELLRLIPGAYSLWLRLWGAKIGRLVFWSPGLRILDRGHVEIGDEAMMGIGALVTAHHVNRIEGGQLELVFARPKIGARAIIGGLSSMSPGSEVDANEMLPAMMGLAPGYFWAAGRRQKKYLGK